jgi:hypothetical protein
MVNEAIRPFVIGSGKQPFFVDKHRARIGGLPGKLRQHRLIANCLHDPDSKKIAPARRAYRLTSKANQIQTQENQKQKSNIKVQMSRL